MAATATRAIANFRLLIKDKSQKYAIFAKYAISYKLIVLIKMFKRVFLIPLFLVGIILGCKKNSPAANSGVPNVAVSFTVNVNNPLYSNLLTVGGWVYVTGGYDGIILFCNGQGSYLAFDRGCPYDCETNSKAIVNVQNGGIKAICPVCGSTYSLYSGTATGGPGSVALKQYQTSFDGSNLTVSN